jgi:hypothetical protein
VLVVHPVVGADLVRVADLDVVRAGDVRDAAVEHVAGVVLALLQQRAPRRAAGVVGALRIDVTLRIGLLRLRVPLRRAALLHDAGRGAAEPVERGGREAGFDQERRPRRPVPLDIADVVMRARRIAELPHSRIGPGREVLALAFPPP